MWYFQQIYIYKYGKIITIEYKCYIIINSNKKIMGSTSMSHYKPPSNLYIVMDNKYCKVWIRKSDKFEHL
jgi:hypothetical protein